MVLKQWEHKINNGNLKRTTGVEKTQKLVDDLAQIYADLQFQKNIKSREQNMQRLMFD